MEIGAESRSIMETDDRLLSKSIRIPFFPLVAKTGSGAILKDADGREFIDFLSFGAISNVGHNHPAVVDAVKRQADTLIHCNPAYAFNPELTALTEELVRITPGAFEKRVAYGVSGADANDGAIKAARAYTGRQKILAFLRSYHGNTYGALSISSVSMAMRRGFGPSVPEVYHAPYPDCYRCPMGHSDPATCGMACFSYITGLFETIVPPEELAAVIMEPIQGDAGVVPPPVEFVQRLASMCRERGILLVSEEVQTGMGRTGKWFAIEHFGVEPDMVVIGKALASGMPLSAIVARRGILESWSSPGHVFCTAGNPVCCAAALATIRVIRDEDLLRRSEEMGARIKRRFELMRERFEQIGQVRGKGLMIGVDLVRGKGSRERARDLAAKVVWRCFEDGLFLTFFSGAVLRICPPLVIRTEEVDMGLDIIEGALEDAVAGRIPDDAAAMVRGW